MMWYKYVAVLFQLSLSSIMYTLQVQRFYAVKLVSRRQVLGRSSPHYHLGGANCSCKPPADLGQRYAYSAHNYTTSSLNTPLGNIVTVLRSHDCTNHVHNEDQRLDWVKAYFDDITHLEMSIVQSKSRSSYLFPVRVGAIFCSNALYTTISREQESQ
jgi:hypothetical protein